MPESPEPELHGLDPGELLARGLNTVRLTGNGRDWTPPTAEELAVLLPQYRIERMIGHGGMGAVYKGYQERLDRAVAIKVLPAELTADEQFVSRFEREARTLARLQHPGIISIYDFGQTDEGYFYFVMEFVEGTDLRRVLQGPGLEPDQALEVIVQVCEALQAAHRQGVVHRDIKPANILITGDGRVKLADFGLARPANEAEATGITCSNVVLGTPDYMAPEQRAGQTDHRTDIFALGLTLYEMLTGRLPRGAFIPPSRKVHVDVRIDEVVLKALQEEPNLRYQKASDMKTDVDHIRSSVVETAPPIVPTLPDRKPWIIAGAMCLFLGLAAPVYLGTRAERSPEQRQAVSPAPEEKVTTEPASPSSEAPIAKIAAAPVSPGSASALPASITTSTALPVTDAMTSPATTPNSASEAADGREALFNHDWQYRTSRPARGGRQPYTFVHRMFLLRDGTAYSMGRNQMWKWSWKFTGPNTMHIDQNFRGHTIDITFDADFKKFEGASTEGSTMLGFRQKKFTSSDIERINREIEERSGNAGTSLPTEEAATPPPAIPSLPAANPATPTPAAASSPVATPPPSSATSPSGPKTAAEALKGYRWKFVSPANSGDLTFLSGGGIRKSWDQAFPWRWEAVDTRYFMLREMGGKRRVTTLGFNKDFTAFEGPGFTNGHVYRGSRISPQSPPSP